MDLSKYDNSAFDRGASRHRELSWLLMRSLFFLRSSMPCYRLRCSLLRAFGARLGAEVIIKPKVEITFPWKLSIGDHCWLGDQAWILNLAEVALGSNVCISQRAFLCAGNHDWSDPHFALTVSPITIGDGVWICADTFVGPGVTIGSGSVVTAGSVVTSDLPEGMICSGNPCKPIKPRRERQQTRPALT